MSDIFDTIKTCFAAYGILCFIASMAFAYRFIRDIFGDDRPGKQRFFISKIIMVSNSYAEYQSLPTKSESEDKEIVYMSAIIKVLSEICNIDEFDDAMAAIEHIRTRYIVEHNKDYIDLMMA